MGRTETSRLLGQEPCWVFCCVPQAPHFYQESSGHPEADYTVVKPELLEEPTKANTDSQPYPDPYNLNFQGWSMESADSPPVVLKHDSFKYENLFKKKKAAGYHLQTLMKQLSLIISEDTAHTLRAIYLLN